MNERTIKECFLWLSRYWLICLGYCGPFALVSWLFLMWLGLAIVVLHFLVMPFPLSPLLFFFCQYKVYPNFIWLITLHLKYPAPKSTQALRKVRPLDLGTWMTIPRLGDLTRGAVSPLLRTTRDACYSCVVPS